MITKEMMNETKKKAVSIVIKKLEEMTFNDSIEWKLRLQDNIKHYTTTVTTESEEELIVEIYKAESISTIKILGVFKFEDIPNEEVEKLTGLIDDSFMQNTYKAEEIQLQILEKYFK